MSNFCSPESWSGSKQSKSMRIHAIPWSCLSRFLEAERDSVNPLMSAICCIFCLRFSFSLARRSGRCSSHSWNQRGSYTLEYRQAKDVKIWVNNGDRGDKCTSHASVRKLSECPSEQCCRSGSVGSVCFRPPGSGSGYFYHQAKTKEATIY